jgi:hypothetical protein
MIHSRYITTFKIICKNIVVVDLHWAAVSNKVIREMLRNAPKKLDFIYNNNSYLFNEFVCNFDFFWDEWTSLKLEWNESFKGPRVPKKAQITQERVEYNVFLFDEPLKGSKSLKIFKISLTFRFDKLSNLSKPVHTGENSQILTVSNKKKYKCTKKEQTYFIYDCAIYPIHPRHFSQMMTYLTARCAVINVFSHTVW